MPLIDATRKGFGAKAVPRGFRLDSEIADLAALVVVAVHPRPELAGEHLGAEADAEQRLLSMSGTANQSISRSHPVDGIVGAHRPAEYDDPVMVGERLRQRVAETGPADVETRAHSFERQPDTSGGRVLLMQNDQHDRPTSRCSP